MHKFDNVRDCSDLIFIVADGMRTAVRMSQYATVAAELFQ